MLRLWTTCLVFVLDKAEATMLAGRVVHGDVDIFDLPERDEGSMKDRLVDRLFQAANVQRGLLVRAFAANLHKRRLG